jgi:HEAT repeat protein
MTTTVFILGLALFAADGETKPRKPSAIAPSLPALTQEEEDRLDRIVNRFIQADTGRLRGTAARKAMAELEALKAEAIPALIRGLNKAARMNATCPVLTITKKLTKMLLSSDDPVLLEFARDEIGADIGRSKYAGTLKDLRVKIMLRKNALARLGPVRPPPPKGPAGLSTADLAKAASTERGERLKGVIQELGKRSGKEALAGLTVAASSYEGDTQKLAREAMDAVLGRLSASDLRERLEDDNVEVRKSAVRVAAAKHASLVGKVIDHLTDDSAEVRAETRAALKKLGKGEDFGPDADATRTQQRQAQQKWRDWWENRKEK